jgi:hypothetical protein
MHYFSIIIITLLWKKSNSFHFHVFLTHSHKYFQDTLCELSRIAKLPRSGHINEVFLTYFAEFTNAEELLGNVVMTNRKLRD